ncbi:hypothetical protein SH528x_002999 [Novipirellula sp. SH528]|uniref:hypothetical protein n=1 Tax=Novipirellula sp. SH528 TaxID=3454466 RepID=UPI003F9F6916
MKMFSRILILVVGTVAGLVWSTLPVAAQPPVVKVPTKAVSVVTLAKGETREVITCWDEGTGRVPVVFLAASNDILSRDQVLHSTGELRLERDGVIAEYDKEKSNDTSAAFAKDGRYLGKKKSTEFKHLTVVAVRVSANPDAKPGVHPVFVRVVSGTGRTMRLEGEFRVIVSD